MVRVMGLYQLHEFLTIEDVAEYLTDKGVYDFDLMDGIDQKKLCNLMIKLQRENKVIPVFYCPTTGQIFEIQGIDIYEQIIINDGNSMPINEHLLLDDWDITETLLKGKPINIYEFDVLTSYESEIRYSNFKYSVKSDDILFPKFDLDQIFDNLNYPDLQQQVADQQATIDRQAKEINDLKAKIAELEQQAGEPSQSDTVADDDKELSTKSLNAVSKLVYVLCEYGQLDITAHQGNTNDIIQAESKRLLTKPLSEMFVSNWIKNAQNVKTEHAKK